MVRRHALQYGAMMVAVLVGAARAEAQPPTRTMPPILADSLTGRDTYDLSCVSCHGPSGLGDGPIATALKKAPADLTTLTRRNGGMFPRAAVAAVLAGTGRAIPSHGTTDMPAWGPLFRAFESEDRARVRVDNQIGRAHV